MQRILRKVLSIFFSHRHSLKVGAIGGEEVTKEELIKRMVDREGGYYITKTQLARFIGAKRSETVRQYVEDLPVLNRRYYFIPDVAERMMADTKK